MNKQDGGGKKSEKLRLSEQKRHRRNYSLSRISYNL